MIFQQFTELAQIATSDLIATFGLITSFFSMWVAYRALVVSKLAFDRDDGNLDVSLEYSSILNGTTLQKEGEAIFLKIVNVGRRPVILSSVVGDKSGRLIRCLEPISFGWIKKTSMMLTGPQIGPLIYLNSIPKILHEGEISQHSLELPKFEKLGDLITNDFKNFYVYDSVGRKHFVSKQVLQRFKCAWRKKIVTS